MIRYSTLKWFSFVSFIGMLGCGVVLYVKSYENRKVRKKIGYLNQEMLHLNQSTHVLKAEWGYLNSPDRLKSLNDKFLKLKPVRVAQLASWQDTQPKKKKRYIFAAENREEQHAV